MLALEQFVQVAHRDVVGVGDHPQRQGRVGELLLDESVDAPPKGLLPDVGRNLVLAVNRAASAAVSRSTMVVPSRAPSATPKSPRWATTWRAKEEKSAPAPWSPRMRTPLSRVTSSWAVAATPAGT
jgi:hypothetical protein